MAEIKLAERLDYQSLSSLKTELESVSEETLTLDASDMRHLGAQALQLLLSAIKTRAANGQNTTLSNASDACVDCLSLFGFSPETLTDPEAWS